MIVDSGVDWKRRGLFRFDVPEIGSVARTHLSAGDAAPFLEQSTYEALGFQPPFATLPTREEYLVAAGGRGEHHRFDAIWVGGA